MKCRGWSPAVNNTCVQLEQDLITLWSEVTQIGKGKYVTIANNRFYINITIKPKSMSGSLNVIKILLFIPFSYTQTTRIYEVIFFISLNC